MAPKLKTSSKLWYDEPENTANEPFNTQRPKLWNNDGDKSKNKLDNKKYLEQAPRLKNNSGNLYLMKRNEKAIRESKNKK